MIFKTLLISAILVTVITGSVLQCYHCVGSTESDCAEGKARAMGIRSCTPYIIGPHSVPIASYLGFPATGYSNETEKFLEMHPVCMSVTFTSHNPNIAVRGCGGVPEGVDPCEYIEENSHDPVKNCKSCKEDLCNRSE